MEIIMVVMRKGITPIISIIVLLLITIGLVGIAWLYLSGNLLSRTEKSIEVPFNGAWCDASGAYVTVTNTGIKDLAAGDFAMAQIGGDTDLGVAIAARQSQLITSAACGGACSGPVDYTFVVAGSVAQGTLSCP
jgi:flagellin-like protein